MPRSIDFLISHAALQQQVQTPSQNTTSEIQKHEKNIQNPPNKNCSLSERVRYKIAPCLRVIFLLTQMIHICDSNELVPICTHQSYSLGRLSKQYIVTKQLNHAVQYFTQVNTFSEFHASQRPFKGQKQNYKTYTVLGEK